MAEFRQTSGQASGCRDQGRNLNSIEYQSTSPVVCERAGSFSYVPGGFGTPRIDVVNLNPLDLPVIAFVFDPDSRRSILIDVSDCSYDLSGSDVLDSTSDRCN
jgi:hypothetical protein